MITGLTDIRRGNIIHQVIFFAVLMCVSAELSAQVPIISLNDDLDGERVTRQLSVYKSGEVESPESVWQMMSNNPNKGDLDFGFTDQYFWLGVTLEKHVDDTRQEWLFEIENPHFNYLDFYQLDRTTGEWVLLAESGRRTPFSTRMHSHFNYVFPVEFGPDNTADLLIFLNKKNSSISYHSRVWKTATFNYNQQIQYTLVGIYFGIFLLILIASIIAFLFSRKTIYFWYMVYVFSVGIYIFTDIGLSQQFLWPNVYVISSFARVALACAMVLSFILFTSEYFSTKKYYPRINIVFNFLIGLTVVIILFYLVFTQEFRANATAFLTLLYAVILTAISLAIWTSIQYLKRQKNVALFFIAAFAFIFIGSFITISAEFGIISDNRFLFTPLQIGSVFEILFLTCGLGWRVKVVNQEQRELQGRIDRLQNEKLKAYIEGIEEERRRLAMDLHDAIGNRLAHLKRLSEKKPTSENHLTKEISSIIQDVRLLSHQLSPPSIGLTGLEQSIRHLVARSNQESGIQYLFQSLDIPEELPEDFTVQIYRIIQEAIQNIEKHSKASEADIQFIGHSDQLIITIEDNGIGFSEEEKVHRNGIGLGNIYKRVEQLGGHLEMTTQKNSGVQYLISIPLPVKVGSIEN